MESAVLKNTNFELRKKKLQLHRRSFSACPCEVFHRLSVMRNYQQSNKMQGLLICLIVLVFRNDNPSLLIAIQVLPGISKAGKYHL